MFELDKLYSLLHKLNEVIPIKLAAPIELMRSDTTTDIDMVKVRFEVQISSIKDDSEVVKTIAPRSTSTTIPSLKSSSNAFQAPSTMLRRGV
jgi:hypothetical protein